MKNIFDCADKYLQKSNWKHMAMLKFCLFSAGILAGMQIPARDKKKAGIAAGVLFLITYIPLMTKFIGVLTDKESMKAA